MASPLRFEPVWWPEDADDVVAFLVASTWPFHGTPSLTPADAAEVTVVSDDVASFWIRDGDETLGLVRLLDLTDLDDGSPLFDLRIAGAHRGRGIGQRAVEWLTDHLFTTHPELHRIEATTRHDNIAMQSVFARCGYRLEGRFVEAWRNPDGTRHDALAFAILRREHARRADA
jgi:RimJ/RimL family protein N-acetyltransferase